MSELKKIEFEFEEEDGTVSKEEYYVLEQTTLCGSNYLLVTDDMDSEEGSFLVLKEVKINLGEEGAESTDDIVSYEIPEDENELKSVIKVFDELLEDFDLEV